MSRRSEQRRKYKARKAAKKEEQEALAKLIENRVQIEEAATERQSAWQEGGKGDRTATLTDILAKLEEEQRAARRELYARGAPEGQPFTSHKPPSPHRNQRVAKANEWRGL